MASKVWHTLDDGVLTEIYFPDLGTPAVRDLQLIVSDGKTFAERERDATTQRVELVDPRSLTYRQVNTDRDGLYRITKTYVTDPSRHVVLVDVRFESLRKKGLQLYVLHDPALSNNGMDDSGTATDTELLVRDAESGGALVASPAFTRTSSGYLGTSDGWQDLRSDFRMDWSFATAPNGNVVQTGLTPLTGKTGSQRMTLALGFAAASAAYAGGWHAYLDSLKPAPASSAPHGPVYDVSLMTLAAHEDKTFRGAYIASPSIPWVWGRGSRTPPARITSSGRATSTRSPPPSWPPATGRVPSAR
jgi:glucoamylase